jgi:hypothetical protein
MLTLHDAAGKEIREVPAAPAAPRVAEHRGETVDRSEAATAAADPVAAELEAALAMRLAGAAESQSLYASCRAVPRRNGPRFLQPRKQRASIASCTISCHPYASRAKTGTRTSRIGCAGALDAELIDHVDAVMDELFRAGRLTCPGHRWLSEPVPSIRHHLTTWRTARSRR